MSLENLLFSVRASERWNSISVYIREYTTFSILKLHLKYGLRKTKYVIIDLIFLFYGVRCDIERVVCIVLFVNEYCNFVTTSCPRIL